MRRHIGASVRLALAGGLFLLVTGGVLAQHQAWGRHAPTARESARQAEEREWGRAMFDEYLAGSIPWAGERVNEYVNRLGQNLARASDSPHVFSFRLVYSPELNAQALPGGFVVLNTGAISRAVSEAELASVLAHEIAHINARHWQRYRKRVGLFSLLTVIPLMLGTSPLAMAVGYGSAAASPMVGAKFSRSFEREADRLAVEYLARAGYDPEAAVFLLEKHRAVQLRRGTEKRGLLSTHPSIMERGKKLRQSLLRIKIPDTALETTSEFESIRVEILAYDELYAEAVGDRLLDGGPAPPKLSRRRPNRN